MNNRRKKPANPPTAVVGEHALKDFPWAGKKCHCERSFSPVFIAASFQVVSLAVKLRARRLGRFERARSVRRAATVRRLC